MHFPNRDCDNKMSAVYLVYFTANVHGLKQSGADEMLFVFIPGIFFNVH